MRIRKKYETQSAARGRGAFTLVELLVVIAILSILAAVVVPKVTTFVEQGRMTRSVLEVNNAELALTKMLTDADRKSFGHFFDKESREGLHAMYLNGVSGNFQQITAVENIYTNMFYLLLRQGRNALDSDYGGQWPGEINMDREVLGKLGDTYMDIGKDPWGNLYVFWAGPWSRHDKRVRFRVRERDEDIPGLNRDDLWREDEANGVYYYGWPAPKDAPVYIYSRGGNLVSDQVGSPDFGLDEDFAAGGDDINNWDSEQGWARFYK